jgi:hemolysin III
MNLMTKVKPKLRGVSHQIGSVVTLIGGIFLVCYAATPKGAWGGGIYAFSVTSLFGISAFYHRPTWMPEKRQWLRRLDHSAIFLLIAGTYTPLILNGFQGGSGDFLLTLVWSGAALGMLQSIFWPTAPKVLVAILCVALGWVVVFEWQQFQASLSGFQFGLIATGGVLYTVGAVIYALRRPDPWPEVFGYHEVFHALTIVASVCHWVVVAQVVIG